MHIAGPRGVEQRARLPQDLRPAKTKQKISGTFRVRAQHPAASYPALQARRHRLSALAERAWIPPIRDLRNGACQSHHVTVHNKPDRAEMPTCRPARVTALHVPGADHRARKQQLFNRSDCAAEHLHWIWLNGLRRDNQTGRSICDGHRCTPS
jgi:hypothetical protein